MAAYCWVYDSCHLQADCQVQGSAPEPYARQSSKGYLLPLMNNFCIKSILLLFSRYGAIKYVYIYTHYKYSVSCHMTVNMAAENNFN